MHRQIRLIVCFLVTLIHISGWSAPTDSTRTMVSVSSVIQSKQVPLNRTVDFIVRIVWEGGIENVEIGELTDPVLSNLDVTGTASSNQVTGVPGGQRSVKEIVYTLKPKNLGMGYIDPVSLSYTDMKTNLAHHLKTRRMNVEVVSPVPEKKGGPGAWILVLFGAAFVAGAAAGGWLYLKHKKAKMIREALPVQTILEEDSLILLKNSVDLKSQDRRESFAVLSKLFRRYLSEKYGIAASSATTEELLRVLQDRGTEEGLMRKCEALFAKADVIKFSGKDASQAEIDEAYTAVETVLESGLVEEKKRIEQEKAEAEKKKPKGLKKLIERKNKTN